MIEKIREKLGTLGFDDLSSLDEALIESSLEKVQLHVKSFCNIDEIPETLSVKIVDAVCGEFLLLKKNTGMLDSADCDRVVKSIDEGDVSITFADEESDSNRMNMLIGHLLMDDRDLIKYRRLRW